MATKEPYGDFPHGALEGMLFQKIGENQCNLSK